jgi:hypothetical protein
MRLWLYVPRVVIVYTFGTALLAGGSSCRNGGRIGGTRSGASSGRGASGDGRVGVFAGDCDRGGGGSTSCGGSFALKSSKTAAVLP